MEGVDLVDAFAVVETRLGGAVVCIDLAKHALVPYIRRVFQKKKHGKKRQNGRQISYETETSHTHTPSTRTVLTWHTNAVKTTDLIKAGGVVLARIRLALVHVHFTAWPLIALEALALE